MINGFALTSLPITDLSTALINATLGTSINDGLGLCTSGAINPNSPSKPTGSAPYNLGDFRGYCHLAAGLTNLYAPNGTSVSNGAAYTFYACATKNQINYSLVKLEIFQDGVSLGSTTGNLSTSQYIEFATTSATNSATVNTAHTILSVVSYYNGSAWITLNSSSQTMTMLGAPLAVTLQYLTIGSPIGKLAYTYAAQNNTGSSMSIMVQVQNVTRGGTMTTAGTSGTATSMATTVLSGLVTLGVSNYVGDTFAMNYSSDGGTTWHAINCSLPQTLNYDYTM